MKVANKRIPRGNILLFFSFIAISFCLLLIISATREERENAMSQNGLYSGHQKEFSIMYEEKENAWEEVMPGLFSEYDDFAIYVPLEDPDKIVRGIAVQGKVETPPMLGGEYFDSVSSWTEQPKAVLGKSFQKDIHKKDGKSYFTYQSVEYEVIGVMGTKQASRINDMVFLDFRSALKISEINTGYILDTRQESDMSEVGRQISIEFSNPTEVQIDLGSPMEETLVEKLFSGSTIMDTMYVMVLVSFSLSTILVVLIWLRFRKKLFYVWRLCGMKNKNKYREIAKLFCPVTGMGFVSGLILMYFCSHYFLDVSFQLWDVFLAFLITIGIGTVILFLCYRRDSY